MTLRDSQGRRMYKCENCNWNFYQLTQSYHGMKVCERCRRKIEDSKRNTGRRS